eukprot:4924067-Amphidinium_carterae.1
MPLSLREEGGLLEYGSSRQGITAVSSCEAEIQAALDAYLKGSSLRSLFMEMGPKHKGAHPVHRQYSNTRCNHERRLAEEVNAQHVRLEWKSTSQMVADGFTK